MQPTYLKTYAALVGSICTALLGVFTADTVVGKVLTVLCVAATAFATWKVPYLPAARRNQRGAGEVDLLVRVVVLVIVVLLVIWLVRVLLLHG